MAGEQIRCLVTGATGYIGGRLVPRLLDGGFAVRALARNPDKLSAVPWRKDVEVARGDGPLGGGGVGEPRRLQHRQAARLAHAARQFHVRRTGIRVGFKPAGGISRAKDALVYLSLIREELGRRWLSPDLFRFGASSLLGDIERQLEHHATGAYSAGYRHGMG